MNTPMLWRRGGATNGIWAVPGMAPRERTCIVLSALLLAASMGVAVAADGPAFVTPLPAQQGNSADFTVYQSLPVDSRSAGITGFLQILQDKRVTPEYRQTWGISASPWMALGLDNALEKSYEEHPPANGRIRLVDSEGHVAALFSFEEPLSRIETVHLYGTKFPTYLVSVDYGIGMGSYAGVGTTFMEVRGGHLNQIPIVLGRSLKNDWRIVSASSGAGKEIEEVQCHPNFRYPNGEFEVEYSTYRFKSGHWNKKTFEKIGYWESEGRWPPRAAFP